MLVVSVQMNTLECVYVKLMLTSSQCLMDLCRTDVDHPAARQRCRFSVLALAPHWRRVTFTDEQRYDRDGVVLVRGVLTLAGSSGVCAAHRGAKHLLVPSRLAKLRKALLRRPQGPG